MEEERVVRVRRARSTGSAHQSRWKGRAVFLRFARTRVGHRDRGPALHVRVRRPRSGDQAHRAQRHDDATRVRRRRARGRRRTCRCSGQAVRRPTLPLRCGRQPHRGHRRAGPRRPVPLRSAGQLVAEEVAGRNREYALGPAGNRTRLRSASTKADYRYDTGGRLVQAGEAASNRMRTAISLRAATRAARRGMGSTPKAPDPGRAAIRQGDRVWLRAVRRADLARGGRQAQALRLRRRRRARRAVGELRGAASYLYAGVDQPLLVTARGGPAHFVHQDDLGSALALTDASASRRAVRVRCVRQRAVADRRRCRLAAALRGAPARPGDRPLRPACALLRPEGRAVRLARSHARRRRAIRCPSRPTSTPETTRCDMSIPSGHKQA